MYRQGNEQIVEHQMAGAVVTESICQQRRLQSVERWQNWQDTEAEWYI